MLECPAGKTPWRETAEGPMPLLVPEPQVDWWGRRHPDLWIAALPPGIALFNRSMMPRDLINAAKPSEPR